MVRVRRRVSYVGVPLLLPGLGSCPLREDVGRLLLCRGPGVLFLSKDSPTLKIIVL